MKFNEIIDSAPEATPENATNIPALIDFLAEAEDITDEERAAMLSGYMMGVTYVLAMSNQGDISQAAITMLRQDAEWKARGWS